VECDRAIAAEQAARRAAGGRPPGAERIFWVLRTGAPWRALPKEFGPSTTCYNRFVRWRKAGVWDRIMTAVSQAYDGNVQMIDSTSVRVHQHAANSKKATRIAVWAALAAG
jgi:transposase